MSYVAIYRKFRPQTFAQVKGQESIVQTLQNQIKNDRIGHAYLFTGTRGTGKTSVARIFAKAINCMDPHDGEPCDECVNCKDISGSSFIDVIEIDAASNTGVDDIRRVIEEVQYSPVSGKYKVYIIDEAHMLSGAAANAFLKTLEEPPEYAVFILATTEPHKLPVTILSRCQRYDFKRITTDKIVENIFEYLAREGIDADEKAVRYIALCGDGSMRDALSLLDKVIAFNMDEKLTYENVMSALGTVDTSVFSKIFRAVAGADAFGAVSAFDAEVKGGKDISKFASDLVWYIRNLLMINVGNENSPEMLGLSDDNIEMLKADARIVSSDVLMRYIRILSKLLNDIRFSGEKQILTDVALIKLAKPQMETDTASLADRIRQLESSMAGGKIVSNAKPLEYEKEEVTEETKQEDKIQEEIKQEEASKIENNEAEGDASLKDDMKTEGASDAEEICAGWNKILNDCDLPLLKINLQKTNIRPLNEDTIDIICDSDMLMGRLEAKKDDIKNMIKSSTGIDINVRISKGLVTHEEVETDNDYEDENAKIDMLLKQNIRMEIETEDI